MTGEELKNILYEKHITQADVARALNISTQLLSQTLRAADIKTGFLEKICAAFGVDMSYFYPTKDKLSNTYVSADNGSAVNTGAGSATVEGSSTTMDKLVEEIAALRKQNEKLTEKLLNL